MRIGNSWPVSAALAVLAAAGAAPTVARAEAREITGSYWYVIDHIVQVDADARVRLWLSLPGDRPGQQVRIRNIEPRPAEIIVDEDHGNRIVYWDVTPVPDDKLLLFHYDFVASLSEVRTEVDPDRLEPYDESSALYRRFTRAGGLILTDGEVLKAARSIVDGEVNPHRRAKLLFDWMVANLEFVPGGTPERDTVGTLRGRRGDCGQFSQLYVAMCRALGIPARTVTSNWLVGGRHRYAEILMPPYGWLPVDVSVAQVLMPGHTLFSATEADEFVREKGIPAGDPGWLFGNIPTSQVVLAVGNDIEVAMQDPPRTLTFAAFEPGGIDAEPQAVEIAGLGDEFVQGGFMVPGDPLTDEQAHDMTHQRLAGRFLASGLYDVAEQGCLQAQETDPEGAMNWINLGLVNMRKGLYNKAEACFNSALRGHVADQRDQFEIRIWVHNYLGNCYDLMDRRELAVEQYREVVQMGIDYRGAVAYASRYLLHPFTEADFH
ncbi:hypothetical protein KKG45_12865 [bacterium]|nr:hypothetical protein [bacterium]MBU1074131.1 hypothetical protein [bacterium]MBU1674987.1 hypothetical protein [bacterium]